MTVTNELPDEARKKLAEIFTEPFIPSIEKACRFYLHETKKPRVSIIEDGKTLLTIAEKAGELRRLLQKNHAEEEQMEPHLSEYIRDSGAMFLYKLEGDLFTLIRVIEYFTPAAAQAKNPKRGRPQGSNNFPDRRLAFMLWDIYRLAHGQPAPRVVSPESGEEKGPLPRAAAILSPILGLGSNLARHFRDIDEFMDIKSETD